MYIQTCNTWWDIHIGKKDGKEVKWHIIDSTHKHDYHKHEEITQDKTTCNYYKHER